MDSKDIRIAELEEKLVQLNLKLQTALLSYRTLVEGIHEASKLQVSAIRASKTILEDSEHFK